MLREKHLINELYGFGVCCSYDELLRFKASAAAAANKQSTLRGVMHCNNGLVHAVADNFDATISSANGLKSIHSLASLMTQLQNIHQCNIIENPKDITKIKRLRKNEMKDQILTTAEIQR